MKTKTEKILTALKVLAYIAMIGYAIQAGSQLISFVVSFYNPESAKDIYNYSSLDLYDLFAFSRQYYIYAMTFIIALSAMHVHLWYQVIRLFSDLNLNNPFSRRVAKLLQNIAVQLVLIWGINVVAGQWVAYIVRKNDLNIGGMYTENEYLLMAGIVYIIAQVFLRGIEIQEENELTV